LEIEGVMGGNCTRQVGGKKRGGVRARIGLALSYRLGTKEKWLQKKYEEKNVNGIRRGTANM